MKMKWRRNIINNINTSMYENDQTINEKKAIIENNKVNIIWNICRKWPMKKGKPMTILF